MHLAQRGHPCTAGSRRTPSSTRQSGLLQVHAPVQDSHLRARDRQAR